LYAPRKKKSKQTDISSVDSSEFPIVDCMLLTAGSLFIDRHSSHEFVAFTVAPFNL